ncbi:hypothetical protein KQH82_04125 [bacterium]|nr:hypothetical protein [bacterium]
MNLSEAKEKLLALMVKDAVREGLGVEISESSPDGDVGKFLIGDRIARTVVPYNGFYANIQLDWFSGSEELPLINDGPFFYYAFLLRESVSRDFSKYYICDYRTLRRFALDFRGDKGRDHQDHHDWRGQIHVLSSGVGYFRWGDEDLSEQRPGRLISLNNLSEVVEDFTPNIPGKYGSSGESDQHRELKEYISANPQILEAHRKVLGTTERLFRTGDRVDVLIEDPDCSDAVIEVEVSGEDNIVTGIHQAIKYRVLHQVQKGLGLNDGAVKAYVVAYETDYSGAEALAKRYSVELVSISRRDVQSWITGK